MKHGGNIRVWFCLLTTLCLMMVCISGCSTVPTTKRTYIQHETATLEDIHVFQAIVEYCDQSWLSEQAYWKNMKDIPVFMTRSTPCAFDCEDLAEAKSPLVLKRLGFRLSQTLVEELQRRNQKVVSFEYVLSETEAGFLPDGIDVRRIYKPMCFIFAPFLPAYFEDGVEAVVLLHINPDLIIHRTTGLFHVVKTDQWQVKSSFVMYYF